MDFSYYDNKNVERTLNLKIGDNWSEIETGNNFLNSIFNKVDDGDGVLGNTEFLMLKKLFEMADNFIKKTAGNNVIENKELEELQKRLEDNTIKVNDVCDEVVKNIDLKDHTLKVLRKRFPEEKYNIEYEYERLIISDKETGDIDLMLSKDGKKIVSYNDYTSEIEINNSDEMLEYAGYDSYNFVEIKEMNQIASSLYKQIYQKNAIGLPKTATGLGEIINKVTPENVGYVLEKYAILTGNKANLIKDLIGEFGIDIDKRNEYLTHIKNALLESYKAEGTYVDDISAEFNKELQYQKNKMGFANADYLEIFEAKATIRRFLGNNEGNISANGKIDGNFKQGNAGDCWLLASIKALESRPKGLEILNDSLQVNDDGSVTVHLKGVDKKYTISKEELEGNSQLASGDLDVRAIEIAFNKYFYEERGVNGSLDIYNNQMFVAYNILTGKGDFDHFFPNGNLVDYWINNDYYNHKFTDEEINNFNNKNKVITVAAFDKETLEIIRGEQGIASNHAYAVIRSDSEYVYLVDPNNSGSELKVSREQFKNFFSYVNEMEL